MARLSDATIAHFIKNSGGNFKVEEFLDDRDRLDRDIIEQVVMFRSWLGFQIQITSAFRDTGSHHTGKAVDMLIWKRWRKTQPDPMLLWRSVTMWAWMGVGIYFDWNDGIGFHVDRIIHERPRPKRWLRVDGIYYYQSPWDGAFYAENQSKTTLEFEIKKYGTKENS